MNTTLKYIGLLAILPLFTVLLTIDYSTEAEGAKAVGPKGANSYGSSTGSKVCGDRLCSESEPTGQSSSSSDRTPSQPLPGVSQEEIMKRFMDSLMIEIETQPTGAGETMTIDVTFENMEGETEHVNYNIMATQDGQVVLDEQGVHDHDGAMSHTTMALPMAASGDNPVDVDVEFLGFGIDPPFTGPIGQMGETQVVPEFGTIAVMILGISIISIIAVTARSKVIPRF